MYREIYDIVSPDQEKVNREMFTALLVKSKLPTSTLSQIWDAVDDKKGYLTRTGLYKALALTALAQQGKPLNEKILESFTDTELPKPTLGDLSDLRSISLQVRRRQNPQVLGFRYDELVSLDEISLDLIPEKKGLIIKHVEYEVSSKRFGTKVKRRYNDFVTLHDLLLSRFPYRALPLLPSKKVNLSTEQLELRRRHLRRYLTLISRHPVVHEDNILKFFLTFQGSDMIHEIKKTFRGVPDEFMSSDITSRAKDLVPVDTQVQFSSSRVLIQTLFMATCSLRDIAERLVSSSMRYANDMVTFGQQLNSLGNDQTPVTSWGTGSSDSWEHFKQGCKHLSMEFSALADKSTVKASKEGEAIVEPLNLFLDLLMSYKSLCDRHEKGIIHDHQRALSKMGQYKKRAMQAKVRSNEDGTVEQLEGKILDQESQIANMENRNYFSLHCIQLETQLIHANLELLRDTLDSAVTVQAQGFVQLSEVWDHVKSVFTTVLPPERVRAEKRSSLASPSSPGITI